MSEPFSNVMAEVLSHTIDEIQLRCRDNELDLSELDQRLTIKFHEEGYDRLATQSDLGYSYIDFQLKTLQSGNCTVQGELAPCSFYIKLAYMGLVSDNGGAQIVDLPSPRIANVGLMIVVRYQTQPYLLAQIKGNAIDRNQLLIAAVAGSVDIPDMNASDPLVAALARETSEELGVACGELNLSPFHYVISEWETGNINHTCVARNANLNEILNCFLTRTELALQVDSDRANLEVAALALVPLNGKACGTKLNDIITYAPEDGDIRTSIESYGLTSYTIAIIRHLQQADHRYCLLERSGL